MHAAPGTPEHAGVSMRIHRANAAPSRGDIQIADGFILPDTIQASNATARVHRLRRVGIRMLPNSKPAISANRILSAASSADCPASMLCP